MRLPDEFQPTREPDYVSPDDQFFFWLGDDGVSDDPNWDVDEGGEGEDDLEGAGR